MPKRQNYTEILYFKLHKNKPCFYIVLSFPISFPLLELLSYFAPSYFALCFCSHITILTESSGASSAAAAADAAAAAAALAPGGVGPVVDEDEGGGVDLRTLRAIRVLRPLKLVSGVPSK